MIDALNNKKALHVRGYGYDAYPFKDYSPLNGYAIVTGNVTADPGKYGSGYRFSGGYIRYPNVPAIGNQDFCVEFWLNTSATPSSYWFAPFGNYDGTNNGSLSAFIDTANRLSVSHYPVTGGNITVATANPVIIPGTWIHVAMCRLSGILRIYINGVFSAGGAFAANITRPGISVGGNDKSTDVLNGAIEDFVLTIGDAKYTANFVPSKATFYNNVVPGYYQGSGKIAGTVKVKGVPLVDAACYLYSENNNSPIGIAYTNATGYFQFTGLNKNELFYVVVKQNDTSWEHIVSSRRNPA